MPPSGQRGLREEQKTVAKDALFGGHFIQIYYCPGLPDEMSRVVYVEEIGVEP